MRITLDLDDGLLARADAQARRAGTTVDLLVADAVRLHLSGGGVGTEIPALPVFHGGGGLREGIDPSSNASLRAAADDGGRIRSRALVPPVADTR